MTKKSIPLLLNETMWVLSQTVLVFIFSQTSEISTVVLPISSTIFNLIFVICLGIGNGISILLGNTVGKGEFEEAQKEVAKYKIPMKAQKNSAGQTENVPDFEAVPEAQREAAKKTTCFLRT